MKILGMMVTIAVLRYLDAQAQIPQFGARVDLGLIEYDAINEASGLAASRKHPGVLWTHNDSGDKNRLYALNTHGGHLGVYTIAGAKARDWEDLAIGPGPVEGRSYLYIGDIGDNESQFNLKYVYRIPEPVVSSRQAPVDSTLVDVEIITLQYPDSNRDAETLMIDPLTKDLYLVTKRSNPVEIFRASYPQSTSEIITLERVATLSLSGVVSGDISPSGKEILIKTYDAIYYWRRAFDQKLWEAFTAAPLKLPYLWEPQGEAVCWKPDAGGYYTLSEEPGGIPARLYFYPRLTAAGIHRVSKKPATNHK